MKQENRILKIGRFSPQNAQKNTEVAVSRKGAEAQSGSNDWETLRLCGLAREFQNDGWERNSIFLPVRGWVKPRKLAWSLSCPGAVPEP